MYLNVGAEMNEMSHVDEPEIIALGIRLNGRTRLNV